MSFLRLQAPNLAGAMPSNNNTQTTTSAAAASATRRKSSSANSKSTSSRRLSDCSSSTQGTTIRPTGLEGCHYLTLFLESNMLLPTSKYGPAHKGQLRSVHVNDAVTPPFESLEEVERIVIYEGESMLDCNAPLPMTRFLRSLPGRLTHANVQHIQVHRRLTKEPPLQTATNAFLRQLPLSAIDLQVSLSVSIPQAEFPPGDLELFRAVTEVDMTNSFVRFEKPLPVEKLRTVTLVGNYSSYTDKQAERVFDKCLNVESMTLDTDYLRRKAWIPKSVKQVCLKRGDRPAGGRGGDDDDDEGEVMRYPHVADLAIELTHDSDIAALDCLRFPNLESLKICMHMALHKNDQVSRMLDKLLVQFYPDTLTLELPPQFEYSCCVSKEFAAHVKSLRVMPPSPSLLTTTSSPPRTAIATAPFRVNLETIENLFPRLKLLDLST